MSDECLRMRIVVQLGATSVVLACPQRQPGVSGPGSPNRKRDPHVVFVPWDPARKEVGILLEHETTHGVYSVPQRGVKVELARSRRAGEGPALVHAAHPKPHAWRARRPRAGREDRIVLAPHDERRGGRTMPPSSGEQTGPPLLPPTIWRDGRLGNLVLV
jgi:hypothetical protein